MFASLVCFGVFLIGVVLVDEIIRRKLPPQDELERNTDPRERCRHDLAAFCSHYFPEVFRDPWTQQQAEALTALQFMTLFGGRADLPMKAAGGSSSLIRAAAVWASIYQHRRFVVVFCAGSLEADELHAWVETLCEVNERFANDFGSVPSSPVLSLSIMGNLRGIYHNDRGKHIRPDLILGDDIRAHSQSFAKEERVRRDFDRFCGANHFSQPHGKMLAVVQLFRQDAWEPAAPKFQSIKPSKFDEYRDALFRNATAGLGMPSAIVTDEPKSGCEATLQNARAAREAVERMRSQNKST